MSPDLAEAAPPDQAQLEENGNTPLACSILTISQVKRRSLQWLWPGWLALGKLAVVDGDPEQGKSLVLLDLAARISQGAYMPDETPDPQLLRPRPPAHVTLVTAEDSLEDVIFPRLEAAGADLARIHPVTSIPLRHGSGTRPPWLPMDLPVLEQTVEKTQSRLLIIEPSLVDLDRHCLHRLADLADRLRCATVLLRYLNKQVGGKAIYRGGGSISVIGAARTAMLVGRDPREESMRILASTKNNLGPRPASLGFVLEPISPGVCRVNWLGPSPLLADDLVAIQEAAEGKTAVNEAAKFLKVFLEDGPKATEMCYVEAKTKQIAPSTLRRAKLRLGVICNQSRDLLGLFVPATWELPRHNEYRTPLSRSYGAADDDDNHKSHDDNEIG